MGEIAATNDTDGSADSAVTEDPRRAKDRFALNAVFRVTPLDRDRQLVPAQAFAAVGKDVSTTGLAVSHVEPMQHSRVVITMMHSGPGQFCIEAVVAWTRTSGTGLHETGFKFVRKLS